ncbi:MAG: ABC transporter ATP-binding protein [Treponema sp.]|jgi:simple sugar transport system ATP-binding protein|nr:ABC transporter ATP-binding protein [Treponema sp.]
MKYVIEMRHITKVFPSIVANDDITLEIKKGEIHALLGENGAGKSTLMSILFGLYEPDGGHIFVRGKETKIGNPNEANRLGIGMVHQHFRLVDRFTTLENIVLGVETTRYGVLRMTEAKTKVMEISQKYGLTIDPDARISDISVGMQQRVEILKMLYRDNEILVFDEPTAVLTPQEIEELAKTMKGLAKEGKSIIFISHKLAEIKQVADRCTVLRKGKYVKTVNVADVTIEELSELMVGRKVILKVKKETALPKEVVLEVGDLVVQPDKKHKNKVNHVSFDVRKGEIVCVAGIDNNGQTELVLALTGLLPVVQGRIKLNGRDITNASARERNTNGLSHIPEDRHKYGLVLDFRMAENLVLQTFFTDAFSSRGFLRLNEIYRYSEKLIDRYDIRSAKGASTLVRSMSGGNQQKVILAREIDRVHDLLIAVQPTRGLDVGAIEFIHKQLLRERDAGKAVLLISLELDEVMDVSDRVLVMFEGEIVANLDPQKVTEQELGLYMSGSKREEAS